MLSRLTATDGYADSFKGWRCLALGPLVVQQLDTHVGTVFEKLGTMAETIVKALRWPPSRKFMATGYISALCWLCLLLHFASPWSGYSTAKLISRPEKPIRILCWVVTQPVNHQTKALAVKETWGRRCDKLLFVSSQNDSSLPAVGFTLPGNESREHLWNKAVSTIRHVYDNYLDDYDWFFKADDDTYTLMENLREYATSMDHRLPWFLGRHFHFHSLNISNYLTGGPGYLLTRQTLRLLVERGLNQEKCSSPLSGEMDDLILGQCLENLGALFADTRDRRGLQRFLHCNPIELFQNESYCKSEAAEHDFYTRNEGSTPFSNHLISLHHVSQEQMQLFEYLVYKLRIPRRN